MLALASRSLPSRATRGRLMIVWRRAHSEKMSATGLRPAWWESVSERSRGREARGGRVRGSERRERTLVGRAQDRVRRPRDTLGVRDGGPALERVEEDVEAGRDVDLARARVGVERVDDAEERAHGARGDARLGREVRKVGDGRASRLRGGEGGREVRQRRVLVAKGRLPRDVGKSPSKGSSKRTRRTSLPVPAVVGTAMRGRSVFSIGLPLPMGALMKSYRSASG